ncbi:CxC2 domain-containing protein [Mycena venus]|uniref:CxC2 domain-containing protein n=1 Tax=Mycena venus TaxID=2733690 RepID=A0A8H6Z6F3_9AGAR|nr:CxC2 domain-containing protein [Mycena venus]
MQSRLFPGSTREPRTAYTFTVLKESAMHHLESKRAAYDYLGALMRLTDNSFTADVQNPYENFLRASRVFNYLTLKKRCGQTHGIDQVLPHRPSGNLLVWCPGCPEPGVNSDQNCPHTPHHLRHLNQLQRTLDGNHQCNQFNKNNDPDDVSLCGGKAYFPNHDEYQAYLAKVPTSHKKSTCNYLKVVNSQDKKKFKNMAIIGTVNCQCSHVFVLSCVDMPYGERFANADCALAIAMRQRKPGEKFEFTLRIEAGDIEEVSTYDIACEYLIHLEQRFKDHFPDVAEAVAKMRWGVPALHVQGHQEDCTYRFGTAYMECIGHFHGETAEHYWPEANQLGPIVRQMNNGHRQDTLIHNHGDWNHKTMKLAALLADELILAKSRYIQKRDHFIGLSATFSQHLSRWKAQNRRTRMEKNTLVSVYKHRTSKVPSQQAIFQHMLAQDDNFVSTLIPKNAIAKFMDAGLKIQDLQRQLKDAIREHREHRLVTTQKEVTSRSKKLQEEIQAFRRQQKNIMSEVGDKVAQQASSNPPPAIEDELLYLPSDLTSTERMTLDFIALGLEESRWREGQAFDSLRAIQLIVKGISALHDRKGKNDRGQKDNTRSGTHIRELERRRNLHMESYEAARQGMISLGLDPLSSQFPRLTEADLYMKSVRQKRHVGDSRRPDGLLWQVGGPSGHTTTAKGDSAITVDAINLSFSNPVVGTQMDKRKSVPRAKKTPDVRVAESSDAPEQPAGWLWELGKMGKLSEEQMKEWSNEGDRVQWFRAEAEMQRWQEQVEQKLAELLRTIRSFRTMHTVWTRLAAMQPRGKIGAIAYARQKAAMYQRRMGDGQNLVLSTGYGALLAADANLINFVESERAKEALIVHDRLFMDDADDK